MKITELTNEQIDELNFFHLINEYINSILNNS